MKKPKHRRPGGGRKPADPSGRKQRFTLWLCPAEIAAVAHGGSVQVGLRLLIADRMKGA